MTGSSRYHVQRMNDSDTSVWTPQVMTLPPVFAWFFASGKRLMMMLGLAGLASVICYCYVDRSLAKWVDTLSLPVNQFWQIITRLGLSEWYLVSAGLLLFVYKLVIKEQLPAWRSALVVCCVGGSGLLVNLFKWIFGRYRPPMMLKENRFGFAFFEQGYMFNSFPSGHSATAASLVVVACLLMPCYRWLWLCLGLLIAMSRIFVGAHYASDVIAGWTVGLIVSVYICIRLKAPTLTDITV